MNDLNLQKELIHKIVKTKINGRNLIVAGGAAIDTLLERTCNDIDIFVPRTDIGSVGEIGLPLILEQWGVQGVESSTVEIKEFDSEYGEHTLVYDCTGMYKTSPVKIQFIAIENDDGLLSPYKMHTSKCTDLFQSFKIITSCAAAIDTPTGLGILTCNYLMKLFTNNIQLASLVYEEGCSPALICKSIEKYQKYCKVGFCAVKNFQKNTGLLWLLDTNAGTISTYDTTYVDNYLSNSEPMSVKTFDHFSDTTALVTSPEERVSGLSRMDSFGTSSTRPLSQHWIRTSSVTQELQPTRGEVTRRFETLRDGTATRPTPAELRVPVAWETTSFPAPRSLNIS